jgi:hypothetical protein
VTKPLNLTLRAAAGFNQLHFELSIRSIISSQRSTISRRLVGLSSVRNKDVGVNKFSGLHPVEFAKQYLNSAVRRERAPIRKSHKKSISAASGCQSAYTALDHCVQLVGYGVDSTSGQAFWSVAQ